MKSLSINHTLAAAICTLAMSLGAGAVTAQTAAEFRGNLDDSTSPAYCGQCHTRIYNEWSGSLMQDLPMGEQSLTVAVAQ